MLVVTANWAIGDGTLWRRPLRGLVSRAWGVIQRSALRAGFRHDGRYQPLERLDIVFAGDTFDLYASRHWATGDVRPWHRSTFAETARREVAASALRRAVLLNKFARRLLNEGLVVPSATRQGRPHLRHPTVVPVSVTLLSGDRDGYLEPPHNWPQGVHWANSWSAGQWQVEHGQRFDPLQNQSSDHHEGPTLIQSMHARLIAPFAVQVADFMPAAMDKLSRSLRLLADCHPLDVSAAFWHRLLPRVTAGDQTHVEKLTTCWRRCVDNWQREARRDQVDVPAHFDFLGRFAASLVNPPELDEAAALLADLCGKDAKHTTAPGRTGEPGRTVKPGRTGEPGISGLVLGHLDEPVATRAWGPAISCHCLGQPAVTAVQGGVVAGETVGVSLVQPLGIPRQTAIPRCLHVVDNGVDERVEPLDFTEMSPGVTWQPEGPVVGHPTRMLPRSNEAA